MVKIMKPRQQLKSNTEHVCLANFEVRITVKCADLELTTLTGPNLNVLNVCPMLFVKERHR